MNVFGKRHFKIKKAVASVLAVVLSVSVLGMGADIAGGVGGTVINSYAAEAKDDLDKQLEQLEKEKQELDRKIAAAGDDIAGRQELLEAVNKKAAAAKKKIAAVNKRSEKIENEMCELDKKLRETRYKLEQSEAAAREGLELYKSRLRTIYIAGSDSYSDVLVNASSFYDVLMRLELIERVARHDNASLKELIDKKNEIESYNDNLLKESEALKAKSAEYSKQLKELAEEQKELSSLKKQYGKELNVLNDGLSLYSDKAAELSGEYGKVQAKKTETTKASETTVASSTKAAKREAIVEMRGQNAGKKTTTTTTKATTTTTKKKKKKKTTTTTEAATEAYTEPEEYLLDDTDDEPETTTTTTVKTTTTTTTTTTAWEDEYFGYDDEPEQTVGETDDDNDYSGGSSGSRDEKISTVINYAKGMVGGRYVWAGEDYGATDCSGLVMLSYAQVGIQLPHLASAQAGYGTDVAYGSIQPGDLVFFGNSYDYSSIYHVALYIGDGKIVHAEGDATGIVISYLDSVAQYNNVTCIKRLL